MSDGGSGPGRDRFIAAQERTVSADEAAAYLEAPVTDAERENALALVRWFRRRYPTGAERLAYVRRAHRRWQGRV